MNENPIELIAVLLILIGTIFSFLSSVGLIRLPDVYTRSHAASKSSTMGVLFTLIGTFAFFIIEGTFSIRLFLGIFFVFLTSPVASHVIVRSAYRSKVKLADISIQDDLKKVMKEEGLEANDVKHV
ncbi:monovalent cation/H(+) antiporter subunit G [Bacillus sp. B1-b2]|uniref:monovalent cation/H(+) antiporter subunit G n=1 Tax=Bacillus sp. B1-b2 TaxID=2653201 RepID=UPI00126292F2|nr:monovalent cation/H(+) antiporter subunit G [Bacillus sp. B1-b2]KAB7670726.1 Na+/H+ antiporter subunit G [Bacillus sp. B1-b2]